VHGILQVGKGPYAAIGQADVHDRQDDRKHPASVLEPGADSPPLAGLTYAAFFALFLEGADFRSDLRLGLPLAVPTIWFAVIPDSHRDAVKALKALQVAGIVHESTVTT